MEIKEKIKPENLSRRGGGHALGPIMKKRGFLD